MSKEDGGSAFPLPRDAEDDGRRGMTLRDYFAAAALTGILSNPNYKTAGEGTTAGWCYFQADAMIKARSENK